MAGLSQTETNVQRPKTHGLNQPNRAASLQSHADESASTTENARSLNEREIRYVHSDNFAELLQQLQMSILVSTYQAGKVVALGGSDHGIQLAFHNFDRAMGLALGADRLAIGTTRQIWVLRKSDEPVPGLGPDGSYDSSYMVRSAWFTNNIQAHEMAWCGDELWVVNTRFSCLCQPDEKYSFIPRWQPPFVTQLAAEDRCHLNGLAVQDGRPKYVTAMAESDTAGGWRPHKATTGCVIDVPSGETLVRGFAMPHSPRIVGGKLYVLDSGTGRLVLADPKTGRIETVVTLPGYTRGLAIHGNVAVVALSKIRETSTFGGLPIGENPEQLKCGLAIVDLSAGRTVATFEFQTGVDELFDVQILPGTRFPAISGPHAHLEAGSACVVPDCAAS